MHINCDALPQRKPPICEERDMGKFIAALFKIVKKSIIWNSYQ